MLGYIPDPADSLDPTKDKVWPVLVFEKSRYGDLFSFAHSEEGRELDIHDRLALCGQIGRAVARMHSNRKTQNRFGNTGIIHGDLKPQNVLIFKDEHDSWLARVADFGFSKWHTSESDPLELPRSWPWYAPEYDEYPSFTPQQAMGMDVFSFGMLSLWLIFNKSLLGFNPLKNKPNESRLQRLFNGSLVHEPHLRDVNMVHLMDAIDMADNDVSLEVGTGGIFDVTDEEFNVRSPSFSMLKFFLLISTSSAIRCIHFTEQISAYDRTSSNAWKIQFIANPDSRLRMSLLQCHELKFGYRDIAYELPFLSKEENANKVPAATGVALNRSFWIKGNTGALYGHLNERGLVSESTIADTYYKLNIMAEAEFTMRQEIEGLEASMGRNQLLPTLLKSILSSIMQRQNRWQEAEELALQVINTRKHFLGPQHPYVLDEVVHLGIIYQNQGRLHEAEDLCHVISKLTVQRVGNEAPNAIASMVNLGSIIAAKGQLQDAEDLVTKAMVTARKIIGGENHVTVHAMETLAYIYGRQGRWKEAQQLQVLVVKGAQTAFGSENHDTLKNQWALVSMHQENGEWQEAERLTKHIDTIMIRLMDRGFITSSSINGVPFDTDDVSKSVSQQQMPVVAKAQHPLKPEYFLSDVDARDDDGRTALARAAKEGDEDGVGRLLAQGADVNARDRNYMTPLLHASRAGHTTVTQKLLEHGADMDVTSNMGNGPLMQAALHDKLEMVNLLLPRSLDIDRMNHSSMTALHHAASYGYHRIISALVAGGANLEAKGKWGYTAIMWAIEGGYEKVVEQLLDLGADIETRDEKGLTPLLRAVEVGRAPIVRLLLKQNADIHASDTGGWTALMWATQEGDEDLVSLLLGESVDIEAAHNGGYTPLLAAAAYGSETVVRMLLRAGADTTATAKSGKTALSIAVEKGYEEVAKLLREWEHEKEEGAEVEAM
ncbi:hypothetical protein EKO27_g9853 [Xylaria grammica]|uniref:Protein kinase domain-containing protein n=1 Tax=Xylaria grammica TaxID=363999 RepID=A0A439CSU9_9PEZI|nr:hypothetical protein EKO27_g9853 [Xylaria grammica]